MKLPTLVLSYFSIDFRIVSGIQAAKTEYQFMQDHMHKDDIDMIEFYQIVSKFQSAGYLASMHNHRGEQVLVCLNFNQVLADYGTYDFLIYGFSSVANHFRNSVLPIVVTKQDSSLDIGTGFLLGNAFTLVTARHVIEKTELIQISNGNGGFAKAKSIHVSSDKSIDIAMILLNEFSFFANNVLKADKAEILEDIMTIGYPPIPGFDAIQLYETASINNSYKFSKGQIIGQDTAYLDGIEYILINAKVKGGNSGSPVINKKGKVVGMIVQIPTDAQDASKLDSLGYGIVTPSSEIVKLLGDAQDSNGSVTYDVINLEKGFRIA